MELCKYRLQCQMPFEQNRCEEHYKKCTIYNKMKSLNQQHEDKMDELYVLIERELNRTIYAK